MIPIFAKQIGAKGVTIGLVVAGYWISRILLEIPSGLVSQRFGYYLSMVAGLLFTIAGSLVCAFVKSPTELIVGRALMGLGAPLFFAVATTFVLNLFDAEHRGGAMGVFQGIEFLGTIVGSTFSGYIVSLFDFGSSFLLSAALVMVALVLMVVPPNVRKESRGMAVSSRLSVSALADVFGNRRLLTVSSATFAEFIMSSGIIMTVLPLHASEQLGVSLTGVGLLMGARSIGFVVAMFTMGAVSDRVRRRPVLLLGLGTTAFFLLILSRAVTFVSLAGVILVLGITTGAIWIVCPVLAAEAVAPDQRGAAIGTYRTFFDLGSILGPIIMSAVMEELGIEVCFYIASALLLVNLIPTYKLQERH
jgi:MFS family permease